MLACPSGDARGSNAPPLRGRTNSKDKSIMPRCFDISLWCSGFTVDGNTLKADVEIYYSNQEMDLLDDGYDFENTEDRYFEGTLEMELEGKNHIHAYL